MKRLALLLVLVLLSGCEQRRLDPHVDSEPLSILVTDNWCMCGFGVDLDAPYSGGTLVTDLSWSTE